MTIVEFLNARLDEYAATLDDVTSGPPYSPVVTSGGAGVNAVLASADVTDFDPMMRWLHRDLTTKRKILELHRLVKRKSPRVVISGEPDIIEDCAICDHFPARYPCYTVALMAAVYADHPDYNPEWGIK